jgi:hypothetical protein
MRCKLQRLLGGEKFRLEPGCRKTRGHCRLNRVEQPQRGRREPDANAGKPP